MKILTQMGSIYEVREDDHGYFWLRGLNTVNPYSQPLGDRWWEIRRPDPWPPEVGKPMTFLPPRELQALAEIGNPRRMPGGGKQTSLVSRILSG